MKNKTTPPKWSTKFLEAICPDDLFEEIEGDLIQRFNKDRRKFTDSQAKIRFVWNVLRFFRPGILLRNKVSTSIMPLYMLASYFKIAFRVMLRNKAFSVINISGLVLGITSAILLFLWISHEFSYDQFHQDKNRIFKAYNKSIFDGEVVCWDYTPRVLAPTLSEEYSSVESAISFAHYTAEYLFSNGKKRLIKNSGIFTDPQFLTMFSFPLVKGNPDQALGNPNSIVITEEFAKKMFGEKEPFGQNITLWQSNESFSFTVTGILKDLPSNTDFHFEYLIPFQFLESLEGKENNWNNNSVQTYVKIKAGADVLTLNEEIKNITARHTRSENTTELFLYPFPKTHLYGKFENGVEQGGRIEIIQMLGILGICLVLIACINFINLSTARAQKRSKEIGIRKVTGAGKFSLVTQFLCESTLLAFVAGITSIGLAYLLLPYFNDLIQQKLSFDLADINYWLLLFLFIIVVGILSGSYPAVYLSSFKPVRVLKGAGILLSGRNILRKTLVVLQFGFAITLIFATIVIQKQIRHVQNREIGYDKNNLIYHSNTGDLIKSYNGYKNDLLQSGFAKSVTRTSSPITEGWSNTWAIEWKGKDPQDKIIIDRFHVDEDFTKTAGVKLIAGRDMDLENYPSDSTAVLINEAAVKVMGFEQPIGEIIKDNEVEWHVVGVIEDFILTSPYEKVKPMVLQGSKGWHWLETIHIRLNEKKPVQENIAGISDIFSKYNPEYPFNFSFVDVAYNRKFASIKKTLTITSIFSSVIIFISCLGLFGLSVYIIEVRIKEIGVRKIMGATVIGITKMLCINSIQPIIIAIIIFTPISWIAMNWWLQFSEYRISLDISILAISALVIIAIALVTVSTQTIKAARANPVNSLRSE